MLPLLSLGRGYGRWSIKNAMIDYGVRLKRVSFLVAILWRPRRTTEYSCRAS